MSWNWSIHNHTQLNSSIRHVKISWNSAACCKIEQRNLPNICRIKSWNSSISFGKKSVIHRSVKEKKTQNSWWENVIEFVSCSWENIKNSSVCHWKKLQNLSIIAGKNREIPQSLTRKKSVVERKIAKFINWLWRKHLKIFNRKQRNNWKF